MRKKYVLLSTILLLNFIRIDTALAQVNNIIKVYPFRYGLGQFDLAWEHVNKSGRSFEFVGAYEAGSPLIGHHGGFYIDKVQGFSFRAIYKFWIDKQEEGKAFYHGPIIMFRNIYYPEKLVDNYCLDENNGQIFSTFQSKFNLSRQEIQIGYIFGGQINITKMISLGFYGGAGGFSDFEHWQYKNPANLNCPSGSAEYITNDRVFPFVKLFLGTSIGIKL